LKSCCVTGHRDIPTDQAEYVKHELRQTILTAINDGFTHFISGFAECADLFFADIVVELKADNPGITLEAAIPYRKRLDAKDKEFQRLIKLCDKVTVVTEKYSPNCYMTRNLYLLNNSERVIAVYDGREKGGTAFTVRQAKTKDKEIFVVDVKPNE
jgi:uncharacterized phage-like protein YoqJ